MALETLSKKYSGFYAPRFEVSIENKKLTADMSKAIIDVSVVEKMDQVAGFSMTIHDGFDHDKGTFKWLDHPLFAAGNRVTIKMGYSEKLSPLIVGKITRIESSFFSGESPTLTVSGEDLSVDTIAAASPERTFVGEKLSDIVKAIASEMGLKAEVDDAEKYKEVYRKDNEECYLGFIQKIKKVTGYELRVEDETLHFTKPAVEKKHIITLKLGKDIISFNPTFNTSKLVSEVEVRGHNPEDPAKPFIGRAPAGNEHKQEPGKMTASQLALKMGKGQKRVISNAMVSSKKEAEEMAHAELNNSGDALIQGEGECIGLPELRKGVTISLEGMGKLFSGKYSVKTTTHTFNSSGYRTRFSVTKNAVAKDAK